MVNSKDFILAAELIKNAKVTSDGERIRLVETFAEFFARQNPRFDRNKFLEACGVEVGANFFRHG